MAEYLGSVPIYLYIYAFSSKREHSNQEVFGFLSLRRVGGDFYIEKNTLKSAFFFLKSGQRVQFFP